MMKFVFVLFTVFYFQLVVADEASSLIGLLEGTFTAQKLKQASSVQELSVLFKIPLSDQKLLLTDLKKLNLENRPIPDFFYRAGVLKLNKIEIDFKELATGNLLINGYKINVGSPISYPKAQLLVQDVLARKKANARWTDLFLPSAWAQDSEDAITRVLAQAKLVEMSQMHYSPNMNLEEALIQKYQDFMDYMYRLNSVGAKSVGPSAHLVLANKFTCSGGHLDLLTMELIVEQGKAPSDRKYKATLKYDNKKGYIGDYFYSPPMTECRFLADTNGIVNDVEDPNPSSPCVKAGKSVFEIQRQPVLEKSVQSNNTKYLDGKQYGDFPKVVEACCKKSGCETAVNQALTKSRDTYVEKAQRGAQ